jgi:CubicO group peptidase (beta-lactamase class C family)
MPSLPPIPLPALDAELSAIVTNPAAPLASLSAAVIKDGQLVYHNQFGHRYLHPTDPSQHRPANHHTHYRIASISKLITTLAAMKLVEQGHLDLDADFSEALGFKLRNPHFPTAAITLRMLLSHTASLRDAAGYNWDTTHTLQDILLPTGRAYGTGKMWAPTAAPGQYFQYANLPWGILGTAMERTTGQRFDHLINDLLLKPLHLPGGFHPFDFPPEVLANVATLYRKRPAGDNDQPWNPAGPWLVQTDDFVTTPPAPRVPPDYRLGTNATPLGPQGACRLSAASLATIAQLLLNQGELNGIRILLPSSVQLMLTPHWRTNGGQNGNNGGEFTTANGQSMNSWGLGLQNFLDISIPATTTTPAAGDKLVEHAPFPASGHGGDAYGLTSLLAIHPPTRSALIYLIGGLGFNPATTPGQYSANPRYEEQILTALHKHCLA